MAPTTGRSPAGRPKTPSGSKVALVVGLSVVLVAAVAVGAVALSGGGSSKSATPAVPAVPAGPVDASTVLRADRGRVVYSDNFSDPGSGWPLAGAISDPGTTLTYGPTGYTFFAPGDLLHYVTAPYEKPVTELGVSNTATQTSAAFALNGLGVVCRSRRSPRVLQYFFVLRDNSKWYIDKATDAVASTELLREGSSPVAVGNAPVTVVGMCATEADGQTNRLAMFVNGTSVAEITDTGTNLPATGWTGGIVVASRATLAVSVTSTHFVERDLAK